MMATLLYLVDGDHRDRTPGSREAGEDQTGLLKLGVGSLGCYIYQHF